MEKEFFILVLIDKGNTDTWKYKYWKRFNYKSLGRLKRKMRDCEAKNIAYQAFISNGNLATEIFDSK